MSKQPRIGGAITALVTPFSGDGVDVPALRALVEWQILSGVDGLAVCGISGEGPTLSAEERSQVIETCVKTAAGRVPIIAATGTNATQSTIAFTRMAEALGASAAMVTAPYYSKPGQKGILQHFTRLAAETRLPLIVENAPGRTASDLATETLAHLAAIPAIVGVADASGDICRLAGIAPWLRDRFRFFSGHEPTALAFACAGGSGCISAGGNILPRLFASMHQAAQGGNLAAALSLQDRLLPLSAALGGEGDPARIKYALHSLRGLSPSVRLPLIDIDDDTRSTIDATLRACLGESNPKTRLSL